MSDHPLNPPDAPPAHPVIPEGLGTKLGKWGTLLLALAAALTPLLEGVGAGTSRHLVTLATVLAAVTILGRMLQAAAAIFAGDVPDFETDLEDLAPPSEEDLAQTFVEDAPEDELRPEGAVGAKPTAKGSG